MREKIIKDCLRALYVRKRKRFPEHFDWELKLAVKDLSPIPDDELAGAFAYAYNKFDSDKMPLIKDILDLWRARGGQQTYECNCLTCDNGYVSAFKISENKWYCFKCTCKFGMRISVPKMASWDQQEGFIHERVWKSSEAI